MRALAGIVGILFCAAGGCTGLVALENPPIAALSLVYFFIGVPLFRFGFMRKEPPKGPPADEP